MKNSTVLLKKNLCKTRSLKTSLFNIHQLKKFLPTLAIGIALLTTPFSAISQDTSVTQSAQGGAVVKEKTVNLNKSSLEQLLTLKGIGYSRAKSIIVYREQMGGFKSVDELSQVSGVGEKILSENKGRLTI
ncbi:helix-hairpin-helix domain-containing protein [Colwellia sp. E2M01]|uniref:ComEA family DNA-binding protein n=1 Tax=Colwellia sp. E2M01 TaxID=2841561 RepID=UPI001C08D64A|nr:helix-hairpin-helix domain-containing protein [Colwellia sp. E2M01]MBU2870877.1 helix-hairpin-helix domain-containing protein [Colwellia sp. E2M01]